MKKPRRDNKPSMASTMVVLNNGGEFEEEVTSIQIAAEKLLGPNGRMLYPITPNTVVNCVLSTPRLGKVWYGDLDMIDQADALATLKMMMKGMVFTQA